MIRFQYQASKPAKQRYVLPLIITFCVISLFYRGVVDVSRDARARQREHLENALNRGIMYCYAMEGFYPEDLDYLKDNYGLVYDEKYFFVDYRISAANLFPDVTIIEREE